MLIYPALSLILLSAGFAGLRFIPRVHRGARQLSAGLLNLGFILSVCLVAGWLINMYLLNFVNILPGIAH